MLGGRAWRGPAGVLERWLNRLVVQLRGVIATSRTPRNDVLVVFFAVADVSLEVPPEGSGNRCSRLGSEWPDSCGSVGVAGFG